MLTSYSFHEEQMRSIFDNIINYIKNNRFSDTQRVLLGFLMTILAGSFILALPVSHTPGAEISYLDALFTATTSVCVTGLTVVDTFSAWSLFGQVVILILIQIGGLGIIAFITGAMMLLQRKATLANRMLIENAFNLENISGIPAFLRKVFLGTLLVEFLGGVLCIPVFYRDFGPFGIFVSFFHSISAFCNAGIDIIGPVSLCDYAGNFWLNLVTMLLIILGGIGFIVWWDVLKTLKLLRQKKIRRERFWEKLSLHTKITLTATGILIVGGWFLFLVGEWTNPETLGPMSFFEKVLAALFQSVTTRTAGFASIPQGALRPGSAMLCVILMFIGGSSVGTAGGVKTSTVFLFFLSAWSVIRGRDRITAFKRSIPTQLVRRAAAILLISLSVFCGMIMWMTVFDKSDFIDIFYEIGSALGTAGLSRGVSGTTGAGGKIVLIICMYLGRVGPISLALAFSNIKGKRNIQYPEQSITIG